MIRVTVELLPENDEDQAERLCTMTINNDLTGNKTIGNYDVTLSRWGQPNNYDAILSRWGQPDRTWRRGRVTNFPRLTRGPWDLLYLALRDTVGLRNPGRHRDA